MPGISSPSAVIPGDAFSFALRGPRRPEFITDELLHSVFAATARRVPKKAALRCGSEEMTYGELRRRAVLFSRYLRRQGVAGGDAVVLWMPRGMDMVVAFLGILEAGAYYVPMDVDFPVERVVFVAGDCQARVLVTTAALAERAGAAIPCQVVRMDREQDRIAAEPAQPLRAIETGLLPDHPAYAIYTSGTTGRPKGVMISHRSIRHFVASEGSIMGIQEKDVVCQSASLSFDLSLEEIWLTFAAGATLLIVTKEMLQLGGELGRALEKMGATVWSTVPTLLALQDGDLPNLRLLILGGEACPPELMRRWAKPGRRLFNTYGPTETTVTATWCEMSPNKPVTIGQPLPNYSVYVLDELCHPVPRGVKGELCIGGPGVALGYLNRPKLTAEKFIRNPFAEAGASDPILYRSGDLVSINALGNILFHGRIDTQVKIRGYRIELAEIESVLIDVGGLRSAVAALHSAGDGADPQIVAYLVTRDGGPVDEADLRERIRARLPAYMIPAIFEVVSDLPVLPSGKVDRQNLPPLTRGLPGADGAKAPRREAPTDDPTERVLYEAWSDLFAPNEVALDQDFFLDLGGHSLRAAALVSKLRANPSFRQISMRDVYAHPTIRKLAAHLGPTAATRRETASPREAFHPVPRWRYAACAVAQAISLVVIFAFYSLQLLIPYLTYAWKVYDGDGRVSAVFWSLVIFLASIPVTLLVSIILKWLIMGRTQPGVYPLWGFYYFRWWFLQRLIGVVPTDYLTGTPLLAIYLRLLGARIGPGVHLDSDSLDAPDLIEIGEGTSIGIGAALLSSRVENGQLKLGRVSIGKGCHVGNGAVISPGTFMRDRAQLGDLSLLPAGGVIPADESWVGSPAARVRTAPAATPLPKRAPWGTRFAHGMIFAVLFFIFPILSILPIFAGMALLTELDQAAGGYEWLLLSPLLAVTFIVVTCFEIAVFKWYVLGEVQPGSWPVYSDYYVRLWFVDKLMDMSLDLLNSLYSTLYLNPWYRLLGAHVGERAEISTAAAVSHDLLVLGDESFIADAVLLGASHVQDGVITLGATKIGHRAFIGNSALVPGGTTIGDEVLVGCLSMPPRDPAEAAQKGSSWFGTPAINLPRRQQGQKFDEASTFRPSRNLVTQRLLIEAVRVVLPVTIYIMMNSLLIAFILDLRDDYGFAGVAWRFPFMYMGLAFVAAMFVVAMKWIVIGRYKPVEKPLWSRFVWRSELVTSCIENVAVPVFCEHLQGTPFLALFLRLLGAKIGRRVYMETTDITEHDVVRIGDDAALNQDCGLQTHLFEDRVMKISTVDIGPRCTVGAGSIVLYDSCMEADSSLDDLSMLMKGEALPAGTAWQGSPARGLVKPARGSAPR